MKNRIRNFDIQTKLGSGSYGVIYKALNKTSKQVCVLKQINLTRLGQKARKSAINEATIMGKLVHPFIVRYQQSFIEENTLNIVMEYCDNGDLNNYLKMQNKRPLKQDKIWRFFIEICVGLEYIHKNKILHRDIKTLNIFMNKNEEIKIGDLGVAKMLTSNEFAQTMVGTPFYLSPELCEQKPYNEKSDIWAMGCLLYELCTFRHPFQAQNQASLILKIIRGKYAAIPEFYSRELREVIDLCLQRDYKRRPSATNLLARPKLQEFVQQFGIAQIVEDYSKNVAQKQLPPSKSLHQDKQPVLIKKVESNEPKKIIKAIDGDPKKQLSKQEVKREQPKKEVVKTQQNHKKPQKIKEENKRQPVIILPPKPHAQSQKKMQVIEVRRHSQENIEGKKENKHQFMSNLGKLIDKQAKKQIYPTSTPIKQYQIQKGDKRERIAEKVAQIKKDLRPTSKNKNVSQPEYKSHTPGLPQKKPSNEVNQGKKVETGKQISILSKPPLAPSSQSKQGVIKVKHQKPIEPKVYDSQKNMVKAQGIIKSAGFSTHIESKDKLENFKAQSNQKEKGSYEKIHSAKRPSNPTIKVQKEKEQKKQLFGVSPIVERKSEKIIKNTPSVITQQRKQPKKEDMNKVSRVRKGGQNELARNARNLSRYNQVSKQQEDMIMNLPNNIHKHGQASSDSEEEYSTQRHQKKAEDGKNKTNKSKFQLKEINDELVLQKYEDLMKSQEEKMKEQSNIEIGSESSESLNQQFDKEIAEESAKNIDLQENSDNIVEDLEDNGGRKNSGNSSQAIQQALQAQIVDENQEEMQYEGEIQDQSKEQTEQWSFDEQPELPLLQQKQSPYFEQNNPYLIEQEQRTQNKINHLQIKLQQNMKREDEINKLMQLKIEECRKFIGNQKYLQEILEFFRKKLHMDDEYNEEDEREVELFLKKKGLTDHYKFQNIYKIMHFEMELDNTRKIIQRICKKLSQLENQP